MASPNASEDEDEDAAAMAAAMGFSSFGSHKPSSKKRKFNTSTDAFIEGQELEDVDRGGKKGKGSGGNTMPLGKARVFGDAKEQRRDNEVEIELKDEYEDSGGGPRYMDALTAPLAEGNEEDGPQYMDMSLPAPSEAISQDKEGTADLDTNGKTPAPQVSDEEAAEMQARIDAILSSLESAPPPPGTDSLTSAKSNRIAPPQLGGDLPTRPASSDTSVQQSGFRGGQGRGGDTGGQRNERWYEGYYDPSFNENPWANLEKAKGLVPVRTWVERAQADVKGNTGL